MGLPVHEKRIHLVEAVWKKSTGTATVALYKGTGLLVQTFTQDLSVVTDVGATISRMIQSAAEQARSEFFELEVTCSTTDATYELLSAGCQFTLAR